MSRNKSFDVRARFGAIDLVTVFDAILRVRTKYGVGHGVGVVNFLISLIF